MESRALRFLRHVSHFAAHMVFFMGNSTDRPIQGPALRHSRALALGIALALSLGGLSGSADWSDSAGLAHANPASEQGRTVETLRTSDASAVDRIDVLAPASPVEPSQAKLNKRYLVLLKAPSLWRQGRSAGWIDADANIVDAAGLDRAREAMLAEQSAIGDMVVDLGGEIIAGHQVVLNALLIELEPEMHAALLARGDVKSIAEAPIFTPELADVVETIRADLVHLDPGFDGSGVTVAVIDTGIDYMHAAFGGGGSVEAFEANDETLIEPGSFPTAKVVGGYDLAGTHYSPACSEASNPRCHRQPIPDDDPLDPAALGHGSHVAGIIAGQAAPPRLDRGVASGARLVALKVFGNPQGAPASSDLALAALDWVVGHNLGLAVPGRRPPGPIHVVNMSLGSDWSSQMIQVEEAVQIVVEAGITVVSSAGNAGSLPFVTGSPASAGLALSVASSVPIDEYLPLADVSWRGTNGRPQTESPPLFEANADFTPRILDTGRLTADLVDFGMACDPALAPQAADASGKIALIERGSCSFYDKIRLAEERGSIAAMVFTDNGPRSVMGCGPPSNCQQAPDIPAFMIDRAPGIAYREKLSLGENVRAVLDGDRQEFLDDTISEFSSRGPARFNTAIKPQLTAPGSNVRSAQAGSGYRTVVQSGTSMAGPAAAGAAALLWERSSRQSLGLEAVDIAALLMNHADPGLHIGRQHSGPMAAVMRQGAGLVDAKASADAKVLLRSDIGIAAMSFGQIHLGDVRAQIRRRFTVRNLSDETLYYVPSWRFSFPEEDTDKGLSLIFDPPQFSLEPGQTREVQTDMHLDPHQLPDWQLRGTGPVRNEALLQEHEIDGYIELVPSDQNFEPNGAIQRPRLPFYVLPRQHGCIESSSTARINFWEQGESADQEWLNDCSESGRIEVFGLLGTDETESRDHPENVPSKLDIEAVGMRYGPAVEGDPGSMVLSFMVAADGPRRIPIESEIRILLDTDLDGQFDKVIFDAYGPRIDPRIAPGDWIVAQADVIPGAISPEYSSLGSATGRLYDLDESTSILSVSAAELGIDFASGTARFDAAVLMIDAVGDYARNRDWPGFDVAPSAALDRVEPVRFRFDQAAWSCIQIMDNEDRSLARVGQILDLGGGAKAPASVDLSCSPDVLPADFGLLYNYPGNRPRQQAEWRFIGAGGPQIEPSETPAPTLAPSQTPSASPTANPSESPMPSPSATASPSASPVATATLDPAIPQVRILALHMNQAVQDEGGSIPLVAGRPAILRVDLDMEGRAADEFTPRCARFRRRECPQCWRCHSSLCLRRRTSALPDSLQLDAVQRLALGSASIRRCLE